jgi:NAD(P)H dehydrogenase (quinone)
MCKADLLLIYNKQNKSKMKIAIVYHSGFGHTRVIAERMSKSIEEEGVTTLLYDVSASHMELSELADTDTIVFGSPTYFGNVSAEFKKFMESTSNIWFHQKWKDKFAAGFTNSSTRNGDKSNTLISLLTFAAQHSMMWIPLGILPQYDEKGNQKNVPNGMASYLGLMTMSPNLHNEFAPPEDLVTAELFAKRIAAITMMKKEPESAAYTSTAPSFS